MNQPIVNFKQNCGCESSYDRLLTIREVATFTGLSVGTLYHMVMVGQERIPVVRISRRCIRFRLSDLLRWIGDRTTDPPLAV
jgi:excisionase family DNA binding protein